MENNAIGFIDLNKKGTTNLQSFPKNGIFHQLPAFDQSFDPNFLDKNHTFDQ